MDRVDVIAEVSEKAFNAENERGRQIGEKAQKYIAAVAILVGFKIFNSAPLALTGGPREAVSAWLTLVAFLVFGLSLAFILLSLRVRNYHTYARGSVLFEELKGIDVTYEIAKIKVARMYLEAQEINATINNQRARMLSIGGFLLLTGFGLAVLSELTLRLRT